MVTMVMVTMVMVTMVMVTFQILGTSFNLHGIIPFRRGPTQCADTAIVDR